MMVVNNFPTHDVSAIGRKLLGVDAFSAAAALLISLTAAVFHWLGTTDCDQQELNKSCSAGSSV